MPTKKYKINPHMLKAALRHLDSQGIEVGDYVETTWQVDPAYGGGVKGHKGKLESLDRERGWFQVKPSNNSPGHLRSTIVSSMGTRMRKITDPDEIAKLDLEIAARSAPAPRKPAAKPKAKANLFLSKGKS